MTFTLRTMSSRTGRVIGYAVYNMHTDECVARFRNADWLNWRQAKNKAWTLCQVLENGRRVTVD